MAPLLPTEKNTKRTGILLSIYGRSDVKLLTKSGEKKPFPSVAQLLPTEKKTIYGRSDVKLLTKSREMKQFLSVAPLLLTGIHVTSDNNIILGAMEKVF